MSKESHLEVSKLIADDIRQFYRDKGLKLKATHAKELVAAALGYKSHASFLAEKDYCLGPRAMGGAVVFADASTLINRFHSLEGASEVVKSPKELAKAINGSLSSQFRSILIAMGVFSLEDLALDIVSKRRGSMDDSLSHLFDEVGSEFESYQLEISDVSVDEGALRIELVGVYHGKESPDRAFAGFDIDIKCEMNFARIGRVVYEGSPQVLFDGSLRLKDKAWIEQGLF